MNLISFKQSWDREMRTRLYKIISKVNVISFKQSFPQSDPLYLPTQSNEHYQSVRVSSLFPVQARRTFKNYQTPFTNPSTDSKHVHHERTTSKQLGSQPPPRYIPPHSNTLRLFNFVLAAPFVPSFLSLFPFVSNRISSSIPSRGPLRPYRIQVDVFMLCRGSLGRFKNSCHGINGTFIRQRR